MLKHLQPSPRPPSSPHIQSMNVLKFLLTALLLLPPNYAAASWEDDDFLKSCPSYRCSKNGPEIRFPFRLSTHPPPCGVPGMQLSCSGHDTILDHPVFGSCKVTAIYYRHRVMNAIPLADSSARCPLQKLVSRNQSTGVYTPVADVQLGSVLVGCPRVATNEDGIVGPSSCVSLSNNASQFWYLVRPDTDMSTLPMGCVVVEKGIPIPYRYDKDGPIYEKFLVSFFNKEANRTINCGEIALNWHLNNITGACQRCEQQGQHCEFNLIREQAFCQHHGSHAILIAATTSVAAFVILVATALYLSLKKRYNEAIHLKVEMFLKTYGTSKPTRYTFSDVKKVARRFKEKVGQGGYGTIYKGYLPNGVPVAVKMLENSTGEGEDFINEVATIGQIHHANIVRLLGFCSEGTRRALIYEFMPNDSLERYIFLHDSNISQEILVPQKMLGIATGIARGMEYLHQGCNQRILHFDIKPHNILLDYCFNPKISDFGLAKLCARDQSIVTLTAARGTMGYIAPELYSRNFGDISYKSDVYSFGMLVLEMVSGRRNSDPGIENQNEIYLPQWIYERVVAGHDLVLNREISEEEKEKVKQMAIVALWCIQWNPKNRPSMTKVVNMLTGRLQNLQMPPKPYI